MNRAAIGLRVHSGWAAVVALGGSARQPNVLDRRRIIICDAAIAGTKQPFHAAEAMPLKKAEAHIARCKASTWKMAREEMGAALDDLRAQGHAVSACGLLVASGRPVGTMAEALSSHSMLHTAEGQFFRDALRYASEHFAVPVTCVREKELFAQAVKTLSREESELRRRIVEMGKAVGPPWSQDEKLAALVAWMVLQAGTKS